MIIDTDKLTAEQLELLSTWGKVVKEHVKDYFVAPPLSTADNLIFNLAHPDLVETAKARLKEWDGSALHGAAMRLAIGPAAAYLGVSCSTLRNWEKQGIIVPHRTPGGDRRYLPSQLDELMATRKKGQTNG